MPIDNKITRLCLLFYTIGALCFTQTLWAKDPVSLWFWTDENRQQWQTQLKNVEALEKAYKSGQIMGLELLIAEPSQSSPLQSRFGHAFLRFVGSSGNPQLPSADLSVNFVANVHTQQLSARAGLVGDYAILPEVHPLGRSLNRYLAQEKRPLRRILIPSSPQMRADLIETLLTWWEELKKARPLHLKKEYQKSRSKALAKYDHRSREELLVVELPHPQKGILGHSVLDLKKLKLSQEKRQKLKAASSDSKLRLDFLNHVTRKKMIQKLSQKRQADQMLIQQGSYLHLIQKEHPSFQWHKQKEKKEDDQLPSGMITAFPLEGVKEARQGKILLVPVDKWREMDLKTQAIIPEFTHVLPPRVPVEDLGSYTFLGKNCASTLIQYFEMAELPARPGRTIARRMPLKLDEFLQESLLAPYPEVRLDNLAKIKKKLSAKLGLEKLHELETRQMSAQQKISFHAIYQNNPSAAQALFYFVPEINDQDRNWLLPLAQKNRQSFAQLHGLSNLPKELYSLCSSRICSRPLENKLIKTFGPRRLENSREKMQRHTRQPLSPRDYSRVGRRRHNRPHRVYYKRPEVVRHLHLIDFLGPRFPLAQTN